MIKPDWKRIAGVEVVDDGTVASVWFAHDRLADQIRLYDACVFEKEVLVVIAEGLNARGRWIPIAWEKEAKPFADSLLKRGCNMIPEPCEHGDAVADVISRDISERMRTKRFIVEKRLASWLDELRAFTTRDGKVPREGFPLMAATRHAMAMFDEWARAESTTRAITANYPKVNVV